MTLRIVGSRSVATGKIIEFVDVDLQDDAGVVHSRDVIRHPGGVGVLPIIGDDVVLVRQYRVAFDDRVLEIPAGKLEAGEDPQTAAERELNEELGMTATLKPIGSLMVSPGYTDEIIHLFSASDIVATDRRPDGAEELEAEVVRLSMREALRMVEDGRITDAKTQIALLKSERRTR